MKPLHHTTRIALMLLVFFFFISMAGLAVARPRPPARVPGQVRLEIVHDAAITLKEAVIEVDRLGCTVKTRLMVAGTRALARGLTWLYHLGLADVEILG